MRLSLLVGRQKPIVDSARPAERTVAASSGLSPLEIKQILAKSTHVERARQTLRPGDAIDRPLMIERTQYFEGEAEKVEVPYVDYILSELIEPTLSADALLECIVQVQDRLGADFITQRAAVFEWYDFLATFFALNQKYSAGAIIFDKLYQEYHREYLGASEEARRAYLAFLAETLPFRLGTVLFKAIVDICESLKELDYPSREERKSSLTVCGEEVTPMVLCIDLESIHTPIDCILHSSKKKEILESLFFAQAKDVNDEQRKALSALRGQVSANPLVLSLYYRISSMALRYHAHLYMQDITWQDYLLGSAELMSRLVQQCLALGEGHGFTSMYDEVMSAKQKGSIGTFTTSSGRSAVMTSQAEELTSTYTRKMSKLVTDLDLSEEDHETEALHALDSLFHELSGTAADLPTEVKAAIIATWTEIAVRENLFALAGRAQQLRAHYMAMAIPVNGITSRAEGLYQNLLEIYQAYLEASHLFTRYLIRHPEPWIHELLCELYDSLGELLLRFRPEYLHIANNPTTYAITNSRVSELRNPNIFFFKARDLLHEVGANETRRELINNKILKTHDLMAVDATALRGLDETSDAYSEEIGRLLAEVRVTGAGQFDIMADIDGTFGKMALCEGFTDVQKAQLAALWTEETLKIGCFAIAGRLEHLRAGMLLEQLKLIVDLPVDNEVNIKLLRIFTTLTDACNLFFRFSSRKQEPQVNECLCDLYCEIGDLLIDYRSHFKAVIEGAPQYNLSLHQLSDLRNPLGFYFQAKERLSAMGEDASRAANLEEKIANARSLI